MRPILSRKSWLGPVVVGAAARGALGYLAMGGIALGQEAMLANLPAELGRQMPSFLADATRESPEKTLLYPIVIGPAPMHEDQETFGKAAEAEPPERQRLLSMIRDTNALTP